MSSITAGGSLTEKTHTPLYAAGVFVVQALVFAAPLFFRVGAFETRLAAAEATVERNRGQIDDIRDRLIRIETKQDHVLEAIQAGKSRK